MKNTTTTTKLKIIYFAVTIIGLFLLCVIFWNDPFIKNLLSFTFSIPALLKNISIKVWGGLSIILILILADGLYNVTVKAQRRKQKNEPPTFINIQREQTAQPTQPTAKYKRVQKRHEYIWRIIQPEVERGATLREMKATLKSKKVNPLPTDNTLRIVINKFEKKSKSNLNNPN